MGDFRHYGPVRQPSGERPRTGGVDEEATPAPPVTGPHFLSRRPLHRPGRRSAYRRGRNLIKARMAMATSSHGENKMCRTKPRTAKATMAATTRAMIANMVIGLL